MAWSSGTSLRGAAGAQLRYGHGAPSSTNPASQNDGDSYIDVDAGRLYAVRSSGTWPTTYASLVGPQGVAGPGLIATSGPPADSVGTQGQFALDQANAFLYGPRGASSWPTTPPISLVGPAGPRGGSRQFIFDAGTYWSTGGNFPTDYVGFVRCISNQYGTPAVMDATAPMPVAGSVRVMNGWVNGSTGGFAVTFALYKNGVATGATASATMTQAGPWSANFDTGAYPYAAGDVLQLMIRAADPSVDQSFSGFLTLENAA